MVNQASKICGICGQDCSNKPRTKDPKGQYFCQECYDAARTKQAGGLSGNRSAPNVAATIADPGVGNDDLFADLVNAPPMAARMCPGCGAPLAPDAILCVHCGTAMSGDRVGRLETTFQPALPSSNRGGGGVWPIVIGIISIVLSVGSILVQVASLSLGGADPAMSSADPAYQAGAATGRVIGGTIGIGFTALLGLGGLMLMLRKPGGVTLLKVWSFIKAALASLLFMCLLGLVINFSSAPPPAMHDLPFMQGGMAIMAVMIIAMWLWSIAWPVFLLIWFRRDSVQSDINSW